MSSAYFSSEDFLETSGALGLPRPLPASFGLKKIDRKVFFSFGFNSDRVEVVSFSLL